MARAGNETNLEERKKGWSIRKMQKNTYKCKEFGHLEADTIISGRGRTEACFATLTVWLVVRV